MVFVTYVSTGPWVTVRPDQFVNQYDLRAAERARDRLQGSEISGRPVRLWGLFFFLAFLYWKIKQLSIAPRLTSIIPFHVMTRKVRKERGTRHANIGCYVVQSWLCHSNFKERYRSPCVDHRRAILMITKCDASSSSSAMSRPLNLWMIDLSKGDICVQLQFICWPLTPSSRYVEFYDTRVSYHGCF